MLGCQVMRNPSDIHISTPEAAKPDSGLRCRYTSVVDGRTFGNRAALVRRHVH